MCGRLSNTHSLAWDVIRSVNRAQTLNLLSQHKAEMQHRFALFDSRARDRSCAHGDIDLLGEFDGPAMSARTLGRQRQLSDANAQRDLPSSSRSCVGDELRSPSMFNIVASAGITCIRSSSTLPTGAPDWMPLTQP